MEGGNEEDERMVRVCVILMGGLVQSKKKKSHGWRPIMDDTELKECACLYMCISVSTVLLLLTATVHERKACLCVHACISCK